MVFSSSAAPPSRASRTSAGRHFRSGRTAGRTPAERERLILEALEQRRVLAAVPTVAFANAVADPFIGEQANFTLRFDNVGTAESDVGYAPYVDLFMPVTGKDGVAPGTPAPQNTYDGIDLVSATYLGTALKTTPVTLTSATTGVPHPFAKDASGNPRMLKLADFPGAKAGDKVYVLELPLGSYTPSQPPVDIAVTTAVSNLADVGQALPVIARGGFRFGGDPLDNPTVDPPIIGSSTTQNFTPSLFRVVKENLAHENETATGPNFKQTYRVRVDVADGQTLTNLRLRDVLAGTLQFVSASLPASDPTDLTPSTTTPGGTLERVLASVVGTTGSSDAVLDIEYYVPDVDAASAAVLNANTGDDRTVLNRATASGASWTPLDPRDSAVASLPSVTADAPPLVAKSIATQKSVSGTALPGSLLTYTINFQVSDYFAFQNLVLTDLLGDGQVLEGTPTLAVNDGHGAGGGSTSGSFDPTNYTVTQNKAGTNCKDEIVFRVSNELVTRGFTTAGRLLGGLVPAGGGVVPGGTNFGGTTGTITFTARVQDKYDGTVPSGNPQIVANDVLGNTASIAGSLLNVANLVPNGFTEEDGTSASIRVPQTTFSKGVYAKNADSTGNPLAATTLVTAGDTITYRITYTLPNSSFENLKLTDYLPLPLFAVDDAGTKITGFDGAASGTGDAPAAGTWTFGPSDTFHTLTSPAPTLPPAVTMNSAANSVTFNFGTFDDTQNRPSTIDLLFTVTASNRPFADNLKLANRATATANNSGNEQERAEAIAEVTSSEPELKITKGVVATDNTVVNGTFSPTAVGPVPFSQPTGSADASTRFTGTVTSSNLATTPINSNLVGVDNGDYVTYCIVVENRGSGKNGAYDVVIKDAPPPGVAIPGVGVQDINLRVTDGAGNPLAFTTIGTGLFDGGIQLDDGATGAIGRGKDDSGTVVNDGSNIVVITYDMLVVDNTAKARLTNIGSIENYAAEEDGPDFTGPGSLTDTAVITIGGDLLAKDFVSTSIGPGDGSGNNSLTEAVVGEFVTYKVTVTVPEARMPNAVITDTLDDGLAFVNLVSVTASPGVGFSTPAPQVSPGGRTVTFNLGTITNRDTDNATTETIEIVYRAVVTNKAVVQGGVQRSNAATLRFSDATTDYSETERAAPITIIEPQVQVAKTGTFTSGSGNGTTTGEANDNVSYTITISNPAGAQASTADAFDLTFSDTLPAAILNATLASVTGASASLFEIVGGTLRTKAGVTFDLLVGATPVVLTVTGRLAPSVRPGDVISNTATTQWTSLDGDPGQLSPWSSDAVERTGTLSPAYNDYRASGTAELKVREVALKKSLVATSEAGNGVSSDTRVVPGEIVRWRLVATLPGSTVSNTSFRLVDELPVGFQFLNDGTATLAIVSSAIGGVTSSTYAAPGPYVTGTTDVGVTPTFVIPSANIVGGPFGDGTDVSFELGRVVNNEGSDGNDEFAIVEFNALVLNNATNGVTNGVGNTLDNRLRIRRDGTLSNQSSTSRVTVSEGMFESATKVAVVPAGAEPSLADSLPAAGPFDAGDRVRYRVDVAAAAGAARATLFDAVFADPMPTGATLDPASIRVFRNGSQITSGFANTSTAAGVSLTFDRVDPGDQITVLYDTVLATSVAAGTTIPNTVTVTGTSLPGPRGTISNPTGSSTPGASGATTGERNGSGGAINDYRITAGTSVLIATPTIDKTIVEASPVETTFGQYDPTRADFAIGEIVTYRITVTVPEGVTPSLILSDLLPDGGRMQLFSSGGVVQTRVVSVGSNIQGALIDAGRPGVIAGGGRTTTFNFGTVTNLPDGEVNEKDQIVVEVEAQVMDVAANKAGGTLTNTGLLSYRVNNATRTLTDTVTADIVEPVLETSKQVRKDGTAASGAVDLLRVDLNDVLIYRVAVRHAASSTGPAYSVRIADTLPAGLVLVPGSVTVIQHPDYASSFYDQPVVTQSGNGFSVLIDYIDQPDGVFANGGDDDVAIVEYRATVASMPASGGITNTAVVTYDSLYGERSSVISPTTTRDYRTSDPATVVVALNTISGFVYVDMNNDGVRDSGEAPIAGVPIRLTGTTLAGQPVTLNTTTDSSGHYFFAGMAPGTYIVTQVSQPAGYADGKDTVGTEFLSGSPLALPGPDRFTRIVIPNNGLPQDGVEWNFGERMETDLAIAKTDGTAIYRPDSTTTYRITVTNNGVWDVTGANVVDAGPAGTTPIAWRLASVNGVGGITSGYDDSGSGVSLDTQVDLAPGSSATFEFTVSIPSGYTGLLTNVATVAPPDGWVDKTPGNNTATDTDSQQLLVIGSDTGCTSAPIVRVVDPATGLDLFTPFQPYENGFRGGVRVTTGDIDGDGTDEIIVAPGIGRPFEVKVYKQDGTPLPAYTTFPFGPAYNRGGEIASGNIDGVGGDDLVVSAGGQVNVYLWQGGFPALSSTPAQSFRPFGSFTGDVSLATGDFGRMSGGAFTKSPDGRFEIVTGTGLGARAQVRVYDVTGAATLVRQIQPISTSFTGGVSVSTGRYARAGVADDGVDDVIVGGGFGGNSVVEVYDIWSKPLSTPLLSRDAVARASAFAGLARQQAAVHAAALTDASGNIDIYGVQGSGGFGSTNGLRKLGTLSSPQVQRNSLAAPLRIAAIRK
jgi:fimbrial isopeptide formation D2 family protein/uncharacterized repeat protein (TIGR01451 family)